MSETNNTALVISPEVQKKITKYSYTLAKINTLKEECLKINIKDLDDKVTIALTTSTRKVIKGKRGEIEVRRKELNKNLLVEMRENNIAAKTIREALLEGELHLRKQEQRVKDWKDEKLEKRLQERIDLLHPFGVKIFAELIKKMPVNKFKVYLSEAKEAFEKKKALEAAAEALKSAANVVASIGETLQTTVISHTLIDTDTGGKVVAEVHEAINELKGTVLPKDIELMNAMLIKLQHFEATTPKPAELSTQTAKDTLAIVEGGVKQCIKVITDFITLNQ